MSPEPFHVAVIMDGNGRWATERGLAGAEAVRRIESSEAAIAVSQSDPDVRGERRS